MSKEFPFTDRDFGRLRALVHRHAGISLGEGKRDMVYGRLARRLRALGYDSFAPYCERLENGDGEEMEHFINAITTNLTSFFREAHHFEFLRAEVLPELARRAATGASTSSQGAVRPRLRAWSAGCSTGEEPYSIAMTLVEGLPDLARWDTKLLATDIDSTVLAHAEGGIYDEERVRGLSPARLKRFFLRGAGDNEGRVRVGDELRRLIAFRRLNLMEPWPLSSKLDFIFCRNVVIYFDKPTQRSLFDRMAEALAPGGWLFIGHSESLYKVSERFEPLGRTIYRRTR